MVSLPIDIITNILSRLPVSSILESKLVCKEWLTVIRSTDFATLHTYLSLATPDRTLIISDENSNLYSINLDSPDTPVLRLRVNTTNFLKNREIKIMGSCNGILCLRDTTKDYKSIILLNPVTHQSKVVDISRKEYDLSSYGFGYDPYDRDYNIVRVSQHSRSLSSGKGNGFSIGWMTSVYGLRTSTWRVVPSNNNVGSRGCYHTSFVDGVLIGTHLVHWISPSFSREHYHSVISCFNLCDDKWCDTPLPADLAKTDTILKNLGVFDGYLSVMAGDNRQSGKRFFDVWIMKEYGVAESWVKLLDVSNRSVPRSIDGVVAFSMDGQKMLVVKGWNKVMFWYNPRTKTMKEADFIGIPELSSLIMFHEGFGAIPGGVQIGALDN